MSNLVIREVNQVIIIDYRTYRLKSGSRFEGTEMEGIRSDVETGDIGQPLCSTVMYKGEYFGARLERLRNGRNSASIWMSRRSGDRMRKTNERKCTRLICDEEVTKHHSILTKLVIVTRKAARDMGSVVYERPAKKFRTSIRMKKRSVVPEVDVSAFAPEAEHVLYEDVLIWKARRKGKGKNGRSHAPRMGRIGVGKKLRRTRKRRVVNISQFRLFDDVGDSTRRANIRMVQDIGGKGRNQDVDTDGTSDRDKFCRSLDLAYSCTNFLYNGWKDLPFLRCCGGKRTKQKYVCLSTLRLTRRLINGRTVKFVMVNIIVEEQARKLRNICIRREVGNGYGAGDERNDDAGRDFHETERYL